MLLSVILFWITRAGRLREWSHIFVYYRSVGIREQLFHLLDSLGGGGEGEGGVLLGILGGGVPPGSPNPDTDFRPKNVTFHTRFQTRPLKSIPVFRPCCWAEIMLSLLRLERKQENSSNPFRIRIFSFLFYSFGIETINTFIHSRSSLKNYTRFQAKMGKVQTRFQTKTAQKPYPMGRHIPI